MKLPSQDYLQSRIDYNPQTGEARWKPVDESYGSEWKAFNTRYASKSLRKSYTKLNGKSYRTGHLVYKLYHNKEVLQLRFLDNDSSNLCISNLTDVASKQATLNFTYKTSNFRPLPKDTHQLLVYNHKIGILTWLPRDNKSWNARFAGIAAGSRISNTYTNIKIESVAYGAHRLAWYLYYGVDPIEYQIDHIDGNKQANMINNLRLANHGFNTQQAKSGVKGYRLTREGKFLASIRITGTDINLGIFDNPAEARQAYEAALQKYKPIYQFTPEEQNLLDQLYNTYPNCSSDLQHACHELQVKALNYYVDAAIVQTPKN